MSERDNSGNGAFRPPPFAAFRWAERRIAFGRTDCRGTRAPFTAICAGEGPQSSLTRKGILVQPLSVWVVDDNADVVTTLVAILRDQGYEARGCRTGQAALGRLRQGLRPDVIISDIAMPKVSGWMLAQEVRRGLGERPLLIAITGRYTKSVDEKTSETSGFDYYLTKPADPDVLLKLIQEHRWK